MKTRNIALLINDLLEKEVGNVFGSDGMVRNEAAFVYEAENDEVTVKVYLIVESKQ